MGEKGGWASHLQPHNQRREHDVEERNQLEALAARKHVTTQCQLDVRSLQPFATGRVDRLRAAERVGGEQTRVVDVPRSKPPLRASPQFTSL